MSAKIRQILKKREIIVNFFSVSINKLEKN